MPFRDFQAFLEALRRKDLLDTIDVTADPDLEIAAIADRVSKNRGNALLFSRVKGSPYPLAINTLGSCERLCLGLGVSDLDSIAARIARYMDLRSYAGISGKLRMIPLLLPLAFLFPRKVRRAPCQEVVEEPDLGTLPILKCWPQDGGRFLTLPLVFTKDPDTGQQNAGMYRMQVYDSRTTGMHWHLHKDGSGICEKYRKLGRRMPVSVALGCDPAVIYAATAPLPKMIDEMLFAGFLRGRPVPMVKCRTNGLYVPAGSEFVLEGYVDPDELRTEGPFGDHTGYYSLRDDYPVFHIEKITRKRRPVYPATVVGKPPMEDCYLGKATERIFLPLLRFQCPELEDLDFPLEGVFHNCAIVSIRKAYPLHAAKVLYALWGLGQMMYTKLIVVVDASVNVHDYAAVLRSVADHVTAENHLVVTEGPLDALDHASDRPLQGFRLGVDATVKLPSESSGPRAPEDPEGHGVHVARFAKGGPMSAKDALGLASRDPGGASRVVLVDDGIDPSDLSTVAWKVFNNIDPKRDMIVRTRDDGTLFIGIDATRKGPADGHSRPWPDDIAADPRTEERIRERWQEYGIRLDP